MLLMLTILCKSLSPYIEIVGSRSSVGLLSGTIHSEIGLLSNLEILRFTNNLVTGTLPTELGLLTKMRQFFCKYYFFIG